MPDADVIVGSRSTGITRRPASASSAVATRPARPAPTTTPGWAERGGYLATEHGNSVPRFHITWGTGPGLTEPFERRLRDGVARGKVTLTIPPPRGSPDHLRRRAERRGRDRARAERGLPRAASSRIAAGEFELAAQAVVLTSGGIGANHDLVRSAWPDSLGKPPARMLSGVPAHVDGRMLGIAQDAGASVINPDRMWHYTEGIENWKAIWPRHGIRILPGPSSLWLDARLRRSGM